MISAGGGGRDRDQIGQRLQPSERTTCSVERHDEADRIIDQKGRQNAGHQRYDDKQEKLRVRIFDGERAQRPECA